MTARSYGQKFTIWSLTNAHWIVFCLEFDVKFYDSTTRGRGGGLVSYYNFTVADKTSPLPPMTLRKHSARVTACVKQNNICMCAQASQPTVRVLSLYEQHRTNTIWNHQQCLLISAKCAAAKHHQHHPLPTHHQHHHPTHGIHKITFRERDWERERESSVNSIKTLDTFCPSNTHTNKQYFPSETLLWIAICVAPHMVERVSYGQKTEQQKQPKARAEER